MTTLHYDIETIHLLYCCVVAMNWFSINALGNQSRNQEDSKITAFARSHPPSNCFSVLSEWNTFGKKGQTTTYFDGLGG